MNRLPSWVRYHHHDDDDCESSSNRFNNNNNNDTATDKATIHVNNNNNYEHHDHHHHSVKNHTNCDTKNHNFIRRMMTFNYNITTSTSTRRRTTSKIKNQNNPTITSIHTKNVIDQWIKMKEKEKIMFSNVTTTTTTTTNDQRYNQKQKQVEQNLRHRYIMNELVKMTTTTCRGNNEYKMDVWIQIHQYIVSLVQWCQKNDTMNDDNDTNTNSTTSISLSDLFRPVPLVKIRTKKAIAGTEEDLRQKDKERQERFVCIHSDLRFQNDDNNNNNKLYQTTVLGYLCTLDMSNQKTNKKNTNKNKEEESQQQLQLQLQHHSIILDTIRIVYQICPEQICCSQIQKGYTPFRDAVCNPTILPRIIQLFLGPSPLPPPPKASISTTVPRITPPYAMIDEHGIVPIEYLIRILERDEYNPTINSNDYNDDHAANNNIHTNALKSIEYILQVRDHDKQRNMKQQQQQQQNQPMQQQQLRRHRPFLYPGIIGQQSSSSSSSSSPLIYLLTHGTSFRTNNNMMYPCHHMNHHHHHHHDQFYRYHILVQCVQLFVQYEPMLLLQYESIHSQCTPLHCAIRNYGNYVPLIHTLIQLERKIIMNHDDSTTTQQQQQRDLFLPSSYSSSLLRRNVEGNLPLHVACTVGVPMTVLNTLLQQTAAIAAAIGTNTNIATVVQDHEWKQKRISSLATTPTPTAPLLFTRTKMIWNNYIPHTFIWSTNKDGSTLIDCEVHRYFEYGSDMYIVRSIPIGESRFEENDFSSCCYCDEKNDGIHPQPIIPARSMSFNNTNRNATLAYQSSSRIQKSKHSTTTTTGNPTTRTTYHLLQELVHEMITNMSMQQQQQQQQQHHYSSTDDCTTSRMNSIDHDDHGVDVLLQRIFFIIRGCFQHLNHNSHNRHNNTCVFDHVTTALHTNNLNYDHHHRHCHHQHNNDTIVHYACALSNPYNGPTLPLPLLQLIIWKYSEQLLTPEPIHGKLPIHIAVSYYYNNERSSSSSSSLSQFHYQCRKSSSTSLMMNTQHPEDQKSRNNTYVRRSDWVLWIQYLVDICPVSCSVLDKVGRLPIHYALDWDTPSIVLDDDNEDSHDHDHHPIHNDNIEWNEMIEILIQTYPESLQCVDPITQLFPYQAACIDPCLSLDTVYTMLRRFPPAVRLYNKTTTTTTTTK